MPVLRSLGCLRVWLAIAVIGSLLALTAQPSAASHRNCTWAINKRAEVGWVKVPVRSSSDNSTGCLMRWGHRSAAVSLLQRSINTCYGDEIRRPLATDGIFGRMTYEAVRRVQTVERARSVDGVYGPETARLMKHISVSGDGCSRL